MANGKNKENKTLTGKIFGRLTVEGSVLKNGKTHWVCLCDCGERKTVRQDHLLRGEVVSCGCFNAENRLNNSKTHGMTNTRLHRIWKNMKNRCNNPSVPNYKNYGGRGIRVCEEWQEFLPFYEWAMANGYEDDLTIDRIDNNSNYEPLNCRWVTRKEQALNRRSNVFIINEGLTKLISEWDEDIGAAKSGRVRARLNAGWSIEKAVTTAVRR